MINFLHNFQPNAIMYSLGPVDIYWYGFLILFSSILAVSITIKLAKYHGIEKDTIIDLAFWLILGGIVGARIYHVFLELPYYLKNPLDIFKIWQGGLAIHGAIIAGLIIIYFFSKNLSTPLVKPVPRLNAPLIKPACRTGRGGMDFGELPSTKARDEGSRTGDFWLLASLIAPGLALAQAIGRWGNYFNQELFGLPTNLPWGIPIELFNRPLEYLSYEYFHPTFLYESIGNFLIFLILIGIHVWVIKTENRTQNNNIDCCAPACGSTELTEVRQAGYVLSVMRLPAACLSGRQGRQVMCYALLYSLLRFSTEFIRIDQTPEILGLRWPQIVSIIIIITVLGLLLKKTKNRANINP